MDTETESVSVSSSVSVDETDVDDDIQPIQIPSLDSYEMLPGDFIKPDPALTRSETRRYLLEETLRWLGGRLSSHVRAVLEAGADIDVIEGPVGRMCLLYQSIRAAEQPGTLEEQIDWTVQWAVTTISECMLRPIRTEDEALAIGLWDEVLPSGESIRSFWDSSPFELLRVADTLSLDDKIDAVVSQLLTSPLSLSAPAWVWVAVGLTAVFYLFLVATIVSGAKKTGVGLEGLEGLGLQTEL